MDLGWENTFFSQFTPLLRENDIARDTDGLLMFIRLTDGKYVGFNDDQVNMEKLEKYIRNRTIATIPSGGDGGSYTLVEQSAGRQMPENNSKSESLLTSIPISCVAADTEQLQVRLPEQESNAVQHISQTKSTSAMRPLPIITTSIPTFSDTSQQQKHLDQVAQEEFAQLELSLQDMAEVKSLMTDLGIAQASEHHGLGLAASTAHQNHYDNHFNQQQFSPNSDQELQSLADLVTSTLQQQESPEPIQVDFADLSPNRHSQKQEHQGGQKKTLPSLPLSLPHLDQNNFHVDLNESSTLDLLQSPELHNHELQKSSKDMTNSLSTSINHNSLPFESLSKSSFQSAVQHGGPAFPCDQNMQLTFPNQKSQENPNIRQHHTQTFNNQQQTLAPIQTLLTSLRQKNLQQSLSSLHQEQSQPELILPPQSSSNSLPFFENLKQKSPLSLHPEDKEIEAFLQSFQLESGTVSSQKQQVSNESLQDQETVSLHGHQAQRQVNKPLNQQHLLQLHKQQQLQQQKSQQQQHQKLVASFILNGSHGQLNRGGLSGRRSGLGSTYNVNLCTNTNNSNDTFTDLHANRPASAAPILTNTPLKFLKTETGFSVMSPASDTDSTVFDTGTPNNIMTHTKKRKIIQIPPGTLNYSKPSINFPTSTKTTDLTDTTAQDLNNVLHPVQPISQVLMANMSNSTIANNIPLNHSAVNPRLYTGGEFLANQIPNVANKLPSDVGSPNMLNASQLPNKSGIILTMSDKASSPGLSRHNPISLQASHPDVCLTVSSPSKVCISAQQHGPSTKIFQVSTSNVGSLRLAPSVQHTNQLRSSNLVESNLLSLRSHPQKVKTSESLLDGSSLQSSIHASSSAMYTTMHANVHVSNTDLNMTSVPAYFSAAPSNSSSTLSTVSTTALHNHTLNKVQEGNINPAASDLRIVVASSHNQTVGSNINTQSLLARSESQSSANPAMLKLATTISNSDQNKPTASSVSMSGTQAIVTSDPSTANRSIDNFMASVRNTDKGGTMNEHQKDQIWTNKTTLQARMSDQEATRALIQIMRRPIVQAKFSSKRIKKMDIWNEIGQEMVRLGFRLGDPGEKCWQKWRNLIHTFNEYEECKSMPTFLHKNKPEFHVELNALLRGKQDFKGLLKEESERNKLLEEYVEIDCDNDTKESNGEEATKSSSGADSSSINCKSSTAVAASTTASSLVTTAGNSDLLPSHSLTTSSVSSTPPSYLPTAASLVPIKPIYSTPTVFTLAPGKLPPRGVALASLQLSQLPHLSVLPASSSSSLLTSSSPSLSSLLNAPTALSNTIPTSSLQSLSSLLNASTPLSNSIPTSSSQSLSSLLNAPTPLPNMITLSSSSVLKQSKPLSSSKASSSPSLSALLKPSTPVSNTASPLSSPPSSSSSTPVHRSVSSPEKASQPPNSRIEASRPPNLRLEEEVRRLQDVVASQSQEIKHLSSILTSVQTLLTEQRYDAQAVRVESCRRFTELKQLIGQNRREKMKFMYDFLRAFKIPVQNTGAKKMKPHQNNPGGTG